MSRARQQSVLDDGGRFCRDLTPRMVVVFGTVRPWPVTQPLVTGARRGISDGRDLGTAQLLPPVMPPQRISCLQQIDLRPDYKPVQTRRPRAENALLIVSDDVL